MLLDPLIGVWKYVGKEEIYYVLGKSTSGISFLQPGMPCFFLFENEDINYIFEALDE